MQRALRNTIQTSTVVTVWRGGEGMCMFFTHYQMTKSWVKFGIGEVARGHFCKSCKSDEKGGGGGGGRKTLKHGIEIS